MNIKNWQITQLSYTLIRINTTVCKRLICTRTLNNQVNEDEHNVRQTFTLAFKICRAIAGRETTQGRLSYQLQTRSHT